MLKALELPPTPEIPQGTFSSRLRKRMQQKVELSLPGGEKLVVAAPKKRSTTPKENKIDGVVYGWGEDKLAPPPPLTGPSEVLSNSHQKPPHDSRVNLSTLRKFEQEAFYRHDREPPQFDRRVQIWVQTSSDGRPTLETIEGLEPQPPVPTLAHSLDRVLFNSGPHWLRDPRSRVANFDEVLEKVPDIYDFDFARIQPYVTSSKDDALFELAKREGKKFTGSTSSLTSLLSHIFFLISNGREVDTSTLSSAFSKESKEFTYGARWPGGITLRHREGIYSIDSDGVNEPEKHLLLNMGTMLEKFLVHPTDEFDKLRRSTPLTDDTVLPSQGESYHYSKSDKFVMRAQLDAQDHRLPGSGVFDIKTRAVVAIRYDPLNHMDNSGYLIRSLQGPFESFEREQYDLIRAAFLKYNFQVRIGNMDGIFVAYHNTVLMFGFQYFTRQDMDERLFGGPVQGDRVFEQCVKCLETILSEITSCFPGVSVKCAFEASPDDPVMRIYVEPEEWDEEAQGERPLVELFVSATSYLNGTRITGPMNFGTQDDHWGILLNIARSSSNSSELRASIRKERDALLERKNEINFSLPRGMDAKTMAQKWVEIDYTRKPTVDADSNKDNAFSQVVSSISDEKLEQIALRFNSKRRPSKFVTNLRALAKQGRQYLDSLEQGLVEESNDPSVGPHLVRTGTTESVLASPNIEGVEQSNDSMALESTLEGITSEKGEEPGHSSTLEAEHVKLSEEVESQAADMGVLRERSSMQAKPTEEYSSPKGAAEIQDSADVEHGKISVTSDNYSPPTEKGPFGDVQSSDTLDIVGSEDDILGPTNYDVSHLSVASSDQAMERQEELGDEDLAWASPSIDQNKEVSENQNMVTKENAKDTV